MRKLLSILIISLTPIFGFSQNGYYLLDYKTESDINYVAITQSNFSPINALDSVFNFVPGKFNVYRFIEINYGYGFDSDSLTAFRDILILKTNSSNKIVDAFQYTLEWAEMPSSCDLYRLNKMKKRTFTPDFNMSNLQFKIVGDTEVCSRDPYFVISQKLFWK